MALFVSDQISTALQRLVRPLEGAKKDYNTLIKSIGNCRIVLLGEATHGTHEFYKARAEITKRLILEKGFTVIAWEADWPDALRVNRYIRGNSEDSTALKALSEFKRFPIWMWRNADVLDFVSWCQNHNTKLSVKNSKIGIYGLDLYSLHASIDAVIRYLEKVDPKAARQARDRYSCFEYFGDDPQNYGLRTSLDPFISCEAEVVQQLIEMQHHALDYLRRDGRIAVDEFFYAEQNARIAKNAEQYYRAMYRGRPNTWNLRDAHMVDTLNQLMRHLKEQGEESKAILWAHNSHLGDARATQMGERGELNIGQLIREQYNVEAFSVGFSTYTGTVTAASDWDGIAEIKKVRPALADSYESIFHDVGVPNFLLIIRDHEEVADQLRSSLLERAIGVIYRPETERWSHYFHANLSEQFDAVIHFDETRAVEPIERTSEWDKGEMPETFPTGI
jgi:erythromycin esterase-like protein